MKGALPVLGGRKASSERQKAELRDLYKQTSLYKQISLYKQTSLLIFNPSPNFA